MSESTSPLPAAAERSRASHLFQPGQSGNPGGRPKGFARTVQSKAGKNGRKLVEAFWLIAHGTPKEREEFFGEPVKVSTKDRLVALAELADRGWGRPAQAIDVNGAGGQQVAVFVTTGVPGDEGGQ